MLVTGCIVTFKNNPEVVQQVIKSFQNTELNVKLYIVDNSPTNELSSLAKDDNVEYIFNPSNPGFGAAHNIAIKKSIEIKSTYHVVLNPDIYFDSFALDRMVTFMNKHLDCGQLMPKILYPTGEVQYLCKKNPTLVDLFLRRFMPSSLQKFFKNRMDSFEYKDKNYDEIIFDVPYFSGCFMFFRTSILKNIGGFDEKIFMYIEDADITRRMLEVSRTVYYPKATVYHHYAKGSYNNIKLMFYNIHGAFVYFKKWGL